MGNEAFSFPAQPEEANDNEIQALPTSENELMGTVMTRLPEESVGKFNNIFMGAAIGNEALQAAIDTFNESATVIPVDDAVRERIEGGEIALQNGARLRTNLDDEGRLTVTRL